MEDYKVVIFISRHSISFEYLRKGGGGVLQPMGIQSWPQPLAFFCQDDGDIVVGDGAMYAVRNGSKNAFGNYFDSLSKNINYSICGETKPLNYLLLNASELLFRDFFISVLYNSYGPLDNNRSSMPLTIVCESDVDDNERAYIYNLFDKGGYAKTAVVQYDYFVEEYVKAVVSRQYRFDYLLSVLCNGDDMTLTLIDAVNDVPRSIKRLPKFGVDPRVEYVSERLWETVSYVNRFLNKEKEWQVIQDTAKDFLNSGEPQRQSKVRLSDGEYLYNLTRSSLAVSFDQDALIERTVDSFLKENGIKEKGQVLLLLRGNASENDYFNAILRRGFDFNLVKLCDKKFVDEINKRIIAYEAEPTATSHPQFKESLVETTPNVKDVILQQAKPEQVMPTSVETLVTNVGDKPADGTPTQPVSPQPSAEDAKKLNREWRECRAVVKALLNKGQLDDARAKVSALIEKCKDANLVELIAELDNFVATEFADQSQDGNTTTDLSKLKREWREVRASANAKKSAKRFAEARKELEQFLVVCKDACATELEKDVVALLATIPSVDPQGGSSQSVSRSKSRPVHDVVISASSVTELDKLLNERKYIEARDLCRARNDAAKATTLTKIIKSQRSIEMRKNTLNECRKLKNKSQIERIIQEIDEYVALCELVGAPCSEEKKLRKDYKSIK